MACCSTDVQYGYEDSRFEKDVDENFHCSICYNVLKEPRMCRNNEHIFCLACISQNLKVNSQTCPECNEHLTVDTLRRAPRVLNNYLSKLKINCDHASRGCSEFTCLEDLKTHVANCGYAPVLCSHAECGMEINKQEKVHHETEVCEYRKVKCHDCGQIQESVGRLEGSLMELDGKVEAVKEMNEKMNEKVEAVKKINDSMNDKVEAVKKINESMNDKVEAVREMNEKINETVEASNRQTKKEIGEVKKEVKDMKDNLSKVNKDVDEVKVMMTQMLEKLNMLELPSPAEEMLDTPREDILIAGGYGERASNPGRSTEIYSWEKNGWFKVSQMSEEHKGASSFIDNGQLFAVGGAKSKTIETLDLSELPLKWTKFRGELPYACDDHQTVVYQQSVIHIGGFNYDKGERSNVISELQLTSPCTMEELCRMPKPRGYHGAEIFGDKVLILGGCTARNTTDSVLEFDPKRKKCKEMPKLPFALWRMATVRWRDEVVVLGGCDKDGQKLSDVFMYNSKTGKTTALPSMLEKRCDCCAAITGNTIVVMGGENEKDESLSSVECFTMGSSTWNYLPAMNNARQAAVAEVLPSTRKYV